MSLYEQINVGEKVPYHSQYEAASTAIDFWQRTYDMDPDYIRGSDTFGEPIIKQHRRECDEDYHWRVKNTVGINHPSQIISQFNSFLYSQEIQRTGVPQELLEDADQRGTTWQQLFSRSSLEASIQGMSIIIPDTTGPTEKITVEQARVAGIRPYVKQFPADILINWTGKYEEVYQADEILLEFSDRIRYYNMDFYQDFLIDPNRKRTMMVTEALPPVEHGEDMIPVVIQKPRLWKTSQMAMLAQHATKINNIDSILMCEIATKTFSHTIIAASYAQSLDEIEVGQGSVTLLDTAEGAASMQTLGMADVAQAGSLREQIQHEISELYRVASLKSADPLIAAAPESGIAKAVDFEATNAVVKSLAEAAEAAENKTLKLLGINAEVAYPNDYQNLFNSEEQSSEDEPEGPVETTEETEE